MLIENRYHELSARATKETAIFSSVPQVMKNSSVQKIVELGINVLPLVFHDLENSMSGFDWHIGVIRTILMTNGLPEVEIPDEFCGKVKEMVRIYVEYGHDQGYI